MDAQSSIVERIRALANAQGYSLPALEIKLKLGNGTISRWSKSAPNTSKLSLVADFFHVSVDYLLGRETSSPAVISEPDILDEIDIAFYGDFKELTEDDKETLRAMARLMKERRAKMNQEK